MYKNYKSNKRGGKPRRKDYMDNLHFESNGQGPASEGEIEIGLSSKALKDLPHSSYSVIADPMTAALPGSKPYPILAPFNRNIGGSYGGDRNLDGGNVSQYPNSVTSKMLYCFDVVRLQLALNYLFLPIKSNDKKVGYELINTARQTIAESLSILGSTTYTQMEINNFVVATDLPMGDATSVKLSDGSHSEVTVYSNSTDVVYAMSIYYQLYMQELLNTLRWHNSFRLKQGTSIRNAWDREVPILNALYGLFNKKAFISLIDSINLFFEGEYVDTDFTTQAGMINYSPSRSSNSMTSPVIEIQTSFNHPTSFKVYQLINGKLVWDAASNDYLKVWDDSMLNITIGKETKHLWDVLERINDLLSLESTTLYARTTTYTGVSGTDNARYNEVKKLFDYVMMANNVFKPRWSDYRQALDTLVRAGIVNWSKGFRPSVTADTDAEIYNNLLTNDIFKLVMGGPTDMVYDDKTKRWRTFTMWNVYTGIPEFDAYQGGSFLSFSLKNLDISESSDSNIAYLPVLCNAIIGDEDVTCVMVSRGSSINDNTLKGKAVEAKIRVKSTNMNSDPTLSRLVPLQSQNDLSIRVPTVEYDSTISSNPAITSSLISTLTKLVGYCSVATSATASTTSLDPDILSIYQIEIDDVTNSSIAYVRARGPFRGTNAETSKILGFSPLRSK